MYALNGLFSGFRSTVPGRVAVWGTGYGSRRRSGDPALVHGWFGLAAVKLATPPFMRPGYLPRYASAVPFEHSQGTGDIIAGLVEGPGSAVLRVGPLSAHVRASPPERRSNSLTDGPASGEPAPQPGSTESSAYVSKKAHAVRRRSTRVLFLSPSRSPAL